MKMKKIIATIAKIRNSSMLLLRVLEVVNELSAFILYLIDEEKYFE